MGNAYDGIMTVGASVATADQKNPIHAISDTGPCVEIFAPTSVKATRPDGQEVIFEGTSAATPVGSGVAAKFALKLYNTYGSAPSPAYLEGSIMGKATPGAIETAGALAGTPDVLIYSIWR
jgi:subtilisin family serine protease